MCAMMISSFRDSKPGAFASFFWVFVDLSGGKACARTWAHVTVATGTRAVLATSTHEKSIVPRRLPLQAKRKLIPLYLLAKMQVGVGSPRKSPA
jgi:hypothetical protein